ncbi:acylneuraminate cytidylyltransferase family protein [Shinella zoogloeoides]|uniref:acylneuraminate cytidylyltransferase family protein n=1 Tax=Shinella zoogloeoides TaxID=352475 RepID=UPI00273F9247|nr:acylneuraminate cytidylyltransferase family protein [Shinella zoogloeoides]WLR92416.1 acylneuraminate cytidylyltransferase family protein [Shinella zoogloeoides]
MSDMRSVAFIFARGGSKGVPRKNIRLLDGKPLIAHSIEVGLATPGVETVVVSTDDAEIAEVARAHGAEVPFLRPAELAQDNSPEWLAWRHAVTWFEQERGPFDCFVSLPATSPFRAVEDVTACIERIRQDPATDAVITVTEASRSPYFNMVRLDGEQHAEIVLSSGAGISRRQDVPPVYDITTVAYAVRPRFILTAERLFAGTVSAVLVPVERAADIDTEFDFRLAEAIAAMRREDRKETP